MPDTGAGVRSALFVPLFDDLADPALVADLAAEAEEAGADVDHTPSMSSLLRAGAGP
jgi:hypothetical protein